MSGMNKKKDIPIYPTNIEEIAKRYYFLKN